MNRISRIQGGRLATQLPPAPPEGSDKKKKSRFRISSDEPRRKEALKHVMYGKTYKTAAHLTGLSYSQVMHWCRNRAKVSPMDWRNGNVKVRNDQGKLVDVATAMEAVLHRTDTVVNTMSMAEFSKQTKRRSSPKYAAQLAGQAAATGNRMAASIRAQR